MRRFIVLGSCLIATLAFLSCSEFQRHDLPTSALVKSAELNSFTGIVPWHWHQEVFIELEETVRLRDFVELKSFGGIQPGTPIDDIVKGFGAPESSRTDRYGQVWYRYLHADGVVEVGCENMSSVPDPIGCNWVVYARPTEFRPEQVFHSELLEYVEEARLQQSGTEYLAVHISTVDGDVFSYPVVTYSEQRLRWAKTDSSKGGI